MKTRCSCRSVAMASGRKSPSRPVRFWQKSNNHNVESSVVFYTVFGFPEEAHTHSLCTVSDRKGYSPILLKGLGRMSFIIVECSIATHSEVRTPSLVDPYARYRYIITPHTSVLVSQPSHLRHKACNSPHSMAGSFTSSALF